MNKQVIKTSLMAIVLFACGGESKEEGSANDSTATEAATEKETTEETTTESEVEAPPVADLNSTPEKVIETIANAAKTRDYEPLKQLIHESVKCDRDCKEVAGMADHKDEDAKFVEYFSDMVIDGAATIKGDKAEVKVKLGKGASKNETFKMAQVDGKWYLEGF